MFLAASTNDKPLWIIPVLFVVSVITFLLMHSVPGGPWAREKALPAAVVARIDSIRKRVAMFFSEDSSGASTCNSEPPDQQSAIGNQQSANGMRNKKVYQ